MPRIFISYRREETAYPAGWLFDRLGSRFGEDQIFKDVDSIDPGDDFMERITTAVGSCDVLLALIGDGVADRDRRGRRSPARQPEGLRPPRDRGRLGARHPRRAGARRRRGDARGSRSSPPSLAPLTRRQALELSPQRFDFDTNRLLDVLEKMVADGEAPPPAATRPGRSRRTLIAAGIAGAALLLLVPAVVYATRGSSDETPAGHAGDEVRDGTGLGRRGEQDLRGRERHDQRPAQAERDEPRVSSAPMPSSATG